MSLAYCFNTNTASSITGIKETEKPDSKPTSKRKDDDASHRSFDQFVAAHP
jgi:hypothetical protein